MRQTLLSPCPALAVLLVLCTALPARGEDEIFSVAALPGAFESAARIVRADLDDDGELDLVTGNSAGFSFTNNISLWRGLGRGRFTRWGSIDLFSTIANLCVEDFDEDGTLDVVAAGKTQMLSISSVHPGSLWFVKGLGGGSFAGGVKTPQLIDTQSLVAGDFDEDGHLDLLGSTPQGGALLARGHGDGSFADPTPLPGPAPTEITGIDQVAADVDGDGHLDALRATTYWAACGITAWLGHGDGSFAAPVETPITAISLGPLAVGSLDADGLPDLVTASTDTLFVLTGGGSGPFAQHSQPLPLAAWPGYVASLGDFDGDAVSDALLSSPQFILRGLGNGQFGEPVSEGAVAAYLACAADFDGDQLPEALLVSAAGISIIPNDGDGGLIGGRHVLLPQAPEEATGADFNGDGLVDLLTDGAAPQSLSLLPGLPDGSFGPPVSWPHVAAQVTDLEHADLDGDGRLDALAAGWVSIGPGPDESFVQVLLNGPAGLQPQPVLSVPLIVLDTDVHDLDLDGVLDVVAATLTSVQVFRGDGSGGLLPPAAYPQSQRTVRAGDVSGDGLPDVVTGSWWMPGLGAGALGPLTAFAADSQAWTSADSSELADVNADGLLDVLFAPDSFFSADEELHALLALGAGSYTLRDSPWTSGTCELEVADLNGDGAADIASAAGLDGSNLRVAVGLGDGHFGQWREIPSPSHPRDLEALDFDGDGQRDLLLASEEWPHGVLSLLASGAGGPVVDVGLGSVATRGVAVLAGSISPDAVHLRLANAPQAAPVMLLAGLQAAMQTFDEVSVFWLAGTLVPQPDVTLSGLLSDADGRFELTARWPSGLPAGTRVFVQAWMPDAGTELGYAGSNGLMLLVE